MFNFLRDLRNVEEGVSELDFEDNHEISRHLSRERGREEKGEREGERKGGETGRAEPKMWREASGTVVFVLGAEAGSDWSH